jgi:hypothetical protein
MLLSDQANRMGFPRSMPIVVFAFVLTGCPGASVAPGTNAMPASSNRPSTIYVYPFAASASDVTLNQGFLQKTYTQLTDSNKIKASWILRIKPPAFWLIQLFSNFRISVSPPAGLLVGRKSQETTFS